MLRIAGGWIIIITGRTAAWIIWLRRHSRRSVLSKAPLRYAFLKTGRLTVIYSHNNWYKKQGQTRPVGMRVENAKPRLCQTGNWLSIFVSSNTVNSILMSLWARCWLIGSKWFQNTGKQRRFRALLNERFTRLHCHYEISNGLSVNVIQNRLHKVPSISSYCKEGLK